MNLDAAKQESVELVLPVKTLYCRKTDKTWEANKMPKKSIRFIARDFERSIDYIKRVIDELGVEPDDYSDDGTPTYNEESQRKIQLWGSIGITWCYDKCGKIMNDQPGFNTHSGAWTYPECGYENDVTENNIRY